MNRVYVAWDAPEARRFLRLLESHGIRGRVIEDREFPERGELHDTEGAPEVWITDPADLGRATELASGFESQRGGAGSKGDGDAPEEAVEPKDDAQV